MYSLPNGEMIASSLHDFFEARPSEEPHYVDGIRRMKDVSARLELLSIVYKMALGSSRTKHFL